MFLSPVKVEGSLNLGCCYCWAAMIGGAGAGGSRGIGFKGGGDVMLMLAWS